MDGSSFEIGLSVEGGAAVDSAAASTLALADALTNAGVASAAAASALQAGQTAYSQAEAAADRASKALERIGLAADGQRGKLAEALDAGDASGADRAAAKLQNLLERQAEASATAASASDALNDEAAALDRLQAAAATAAENETRLADASAQAGDAAAAASSGIQAAGEGAGDSAINFRSLGSGLGKLGGPLGSIGSKAANVGGALQKLSSTLGAAGPYVAAAVLAVALATGFAVAALSITKFGVMAADGARTSALLSDGIAGSVAGGRQLDATFAGLANKVPLAREELVSMASDLAKTGLKGDALSAALETAAVKAATLKFGPDFAKQMLSLDFQSKKLKAGITGLFSGLKIESLLAGLAQVVALFDSTGASGNAIKTVFESLFQPIVDGIAGMIPKAVAAFIQLEILAMKAMIAIKPYGSVIEGIGKGFLILGAVVVGIVAIFIACAAAIAVELAMAAAGTYAVITQFVGMATSVKASITDAMGWISAKVSAVVDWLSGLSLSDIGTALMTGLAAGIAGSGGTVLAAMGNVVSGAISAAKAKLGIASPSKVFAEIGGFTAEGMAQGVDDGAQGVQSSLETMVSPPATSSGSTTNATTTSSTGGTVYQITIQGGGDAQSNVNAFRDWLEGLGAQAGTAVPNA